MLVFLMQAGFLCLESGKIRSKNSINVAAKNLSDFILAAIIFWMFGFALMFGTSQDGFFGFTDLFYGADSSAWQISFFMFQMMFCGTAATLVSGAVAERMSFFGYVIVVLVISSIIYPIVGHWSWASLYKSSNTGWLEGLGFIDFAGSTIVHSVGGWVALAAVIIIGPRVGRFDSDTAMPVGNNLPMSVLGVLLIWLGWFGFNGGSTLALNEQVPLILLNTAVAGAFGGLAASICFILRNRYIDVTMGLNGVIAGLVSITASANAVSPAETALIGIIGGIIVYFGTLLLEKLRIDDAIGVIPAHLFAGIWGTLCVALFASPETFPDANRIQQFGIQATGIVIIGIYCFCVSFIVLRIINRFLPMRVTAQQEMRGMNISEHRASTELIDLLSSMKVQEQNGDFTSPVPVEPFTEVGQIASQYNQVIHRVGAEIFQRDDAIAKFQSSEKRKSAILESSMDSIITIDLKGKIIEFNPAAQRTFGYDKNRVLGKSFVQLFVLERDHDEVNISLRHRFSAATGLIINRRNTIALRRGSGDEFPAEITVTSANLDSALENEFTFHIRDITRQRKLQSKLKNLAYSDPLTGLYNRTYLLEALSNQITKCVAAEYAIALFFLDLDRFKKINDTLGHKAGDELLLEVAARLLKVTRSSDVIARWGGDEFVILMSGGLTQDSVKLSAQKILSVMREVVIINNTEIKMPTSIGVALSFDPNMPAELLIQQADIAMYSAKQAGRDTYKVFEAEMANKASRRFHNEQAISKAVSELTEFHIEYQPKVGSEGQLLGLEALVRWTMADGTRVSPAEFIPLAEETNLIIPLEEYIIATVMQQMNEWRSLGKTLVPVAINLSGKHILAASLLPFIKAQLHKHKFEDYMLELEVTEGIFLTDMARCCDVLRDLRTMKIKIAVDDFGTGYSSLNYLKTLPIDVLKVDRAFVDECATVKEDGKICETVINLADSLGLATVAEGVETEAQYEFLKQIGCQQFQGYFFSRPVGAEVINAQLKELNSDNTD
jgi:Amt family ammonium transporter